MLCSSCCRPEYSGSHRSTTHHRACGVSPRQQSRASHLVWPQRSGDPRKGDLPSARASALQQELHFKPGIGSFAGCLRLAYLGSSKVQPKYSACKVFAFALVTLLLDGSTGQILSSLSASRPYCYACGVIPQQRHGTKQPTGCFGAVTGRRFRSASQLKASAVASTWPLVDEAHPGRSLSAHGEFGPHFCVGDTPVWRHLGCSQTVLLHLPRATLSVDVYLGCCWQNRSCYCQHVSCFSACGAQPRWTHMFTNVSGGFRVPKILPRPRCSPKRWDKYYSKATLTLSVSHRVSLFRVPCQHVRDRQQQPAMPETLGTQSQEKCPTAEGMLALAECHGQRRNRRCGAAAAPQLQLAARAPTTRARSPAWRRLNPEHVPSLDPRSRSLNQLHPAAAPARIPVIWSARPARKRIPEGSSTRLQLPRRWRGTRRITPRCRSLIFAYLFFSFVLLQIGTPSGHLSTHLLYASLRSEPRSAAPVSAARCWCGRPGAARATLCCFTNARLGHDPQVGALHGFMYQLLACAVPLRLLLGLWFYGGCTLCIQVPLLLSEHMFTSPMQLQPYLPGWLDCLNMVCRSLCCHFRLLVSRCALQVATKRGKGRHTRRFCLLLCLCLSLVGLVPGMFSNHPGAFWRAPARPRHQQYDCMSLRSARPWLFDPTTHSLMLAEGAVAFGPNTVFQRFLFFGESGAMGHSRRSQATKIRSANRPGKRERACIQTTIKLTASAKYAARKPLDRRFDAPTFPPPPPPPPPRRDRVGHVAPQADMLASRDRNLAHSTPSTSSGTEPHPISPEAQLDALRGRLHRKLIESCRGMTDFMPTFVTTKPLPCTGSGPNTILYGCSSEALFSKDIAPHPCIETKSPGESFNRSITGAYMVALCYFLCLASGLCLCLGSPSHAKHQVKEAPAEKHRASTFCCSLGKAPPIDAECWTDLHYAQQCFCGSLADDPRGSTFSFGRGLGWDWISLATLQGWLLSPCKLVELYQPLLARPKVRTHAPARGRRSTLRTYASLCLFAMYLAGCCHMGLALGLQSHPYLEARRSIPTCMPGLDRTRPMHQRLRSAWRALSAPTLAAQKLLFTMIFDRSCCCHWDTILAVAVMLFAWLEVRPQPCHTDTVNQVTDLALVEVLFAGSLWVPLSVISGVLLTALCFRQLCTMPGPKSGEVEATLFAV